MKEEFAPWIEAIPLLFNVKLVLMAEVKEVLPPELVTVIGASVKLPVKSTISPSLIVMPLKLKVLSLVRVSVHLSASFLVSVP